MSNPAHSLPTLQPLAALFCRGVARALLVVVMLLGLTGQILLTAASLPEESPRAAILRLTGLDIAPSSIPAAMQADAQAPISQETDSKNIARLNLAPSSAQTTSRNSDQPVPSAQMTTGDSSSQQQAVQTASTNPAQMTMVGDAPCPDQATLSSPQAANPHASPAGVPGAENEQTGTISAHHGMDHISTVQNIAPVAGHTTAHAVHHGTHHHSHHHGLDCPLCPLLGHVIFILACLSALLSHERLTRRLWQDKSPSRAPPKAPYQHPPSRGPPQTILTCIIA